MTAAGLAALAASFGLAWVTITMVVGPGPAAWIHLSGDKADAGHFFALYSLAAAGGAFLSGRLMDRIGRRPVLVVSHLLAAVGFAVGGLAYAAASLPGFASGVVLVAIGFGGILLTRVAASDLAPPAQRGAAVGRVQVAATFGAIAGPLLLVASVPLAAALARDPNGLVWFLAPPLLLASAALASRIPETAPPRGEAVATGPTSLPLALLTVGAAATAFSEAAMVGVMGVTGAALTLQGHGAQAIGAVMAAHFVGMFGFSVVVGRIADRIGRRVAIAAGLLIIASGGLTVAYLPGVPAFAAGLFLVGLGWCFAYLSATVLLTEAVPASRRARVLGTTDVAGRLLVATAAVTGGWLYAGHGLHGLGLAAAAVTLLPLALVSVVRPRPAPVA